VEPLKQEAAGGVSTALWLLLAAVASVLLIACVNLANLQIARAVKRGREMAVRAALGAGRERLARSALMDSLVLAAAGGTLGILLSFQGVRLFIAAAPANLPRLNEAHVSLPILMAAAGLSILTALLFGLFPALRAMRVDPQSAMQSNAGRLANARDGQRIGFS
jgi:ABC-type antimicrobial peptide transport system permease subunit